MVKVLIVGNLEGYATEASAIAYSKGAKVIHVCDTDHAMEELRNNSSINVVFIDIKQDLKKFTRSIKRERFFITIIACGINTDPDDAAKSIKDGAEEFLSLPPDTKFISSLIGSISESNECFICEDPKTKKIKEMCEKIAKSDANILISGDSGVGKEVIARFIHKQSKRASNPFVAINCAAIPENLLESELFGHERGSFTGAVAKRIGKFETANTGTLFLDEIGELHQSLQVKLLRAIQERTIERVGGNSQIKIDIRILSASNINLKEAIDKNKFRLDLYFRISVINIKIPPLKDRPLDIDHLSEYFLNKHLRNNHLNTKNFSEKSIMALKKYSWPGNVRELDNRIQRAILLSQSDIIESNDLFETEELESFENNNHKKDELEKGGLEDGEFVVKKLEEIEREAILGTLSKCLGNRTRAAQLLGISIRTLRDRIKRYKENGYVVREQIAQQ